MIGSSTLVSCGIGYGVSYAIPHIESLLKSAFKDSAITQEFNNVFYGLGIIDKDKKEKATYKSISGNKNYVKFHFKLSSNITSKRFSDKIDDIKEKLNISNLEIGYNNNRMFFKVRYDERDILYFNFFNTKEPTLVPLGLDEDGEVVTADLNIDSHWLIGGATNCGKSTLIRAIIFFLVKTQAYDLILVDLKQGMEFGKLKDLKGVIGYAEDVAEAMELIEWYESKAIERMKIIKEAGCTDFKEYNNKYPGKMKRMVLIIDEFADLVPKKVAKGEISPIDVLINLARKCRAPGMHIIISTQRPSRDVVEGSLKNNFTALIGLRTNNDTNSKIIIDQSGLQNLSLGECIAVLKGKNYFFYTMLLVGKQLEDLIKKYTKSDEEKKANVLDDQVEQPTVDGEELDDKAVNDLVESLTTK